MSDQRLEPLARVLGAATLAAMIMLPGAFLLAAFLAPATLSPIGLPVAPGVSAAEWWGAVLIGLIPGTAMLWTFHVLRGLFRAYAAGEVLSAANAARIGLIGRGILLVAASSLLIRPIQSVLLTLSNPEGQRQVTITVSSNDLALLLAGGVFIAIGFAMREAARADAENKAFV